MPAARLPLLACACLLSATPAGAFAPPHRPPGAPPSRRAAFLR
eukprot:CAMPEP_0194270054 /NCGR_PEP_ID=MMETSP0169-20130528/4121_1 /TAXON_ID=218684 /ORGANISM="Corethron pennatum, Strain L29A3" /LENGTH=42 /DNA_ID= /DNA_START= /DNA_END= /DNA_ORIENTATION=